MIIRSAELETVCGITSRLPDNVLPEIAFAGKSNVGKSSLVNRLLCRKRLARTSATPGKTQTLNFYRVNDRFYLVDLPGYGYARVSASEKEKWGVMIERYLRESAQLRAVFLLVDMRHAPGENDILMYRWILETGFKPIIIGTKADKLKRSERAAAVRRIRETLDLEEDAVLIPFSAVTGEGTEEIWDTALAHMGLKEESGQTETDAGPDQPAGQSAAESSAADPGDGERGTEDAGAAEGAGTGKSREGGEASSGKKKERWPRSERGKAKKKNGKSK